MVRCITGRLLRMVRSGLLKDILTSDLLRLNYQAIVFDDVFTSEVLLSCEPTVSPLNDNKIDFRIPFDESDDKDDTVNIASFPSPKPIRPQHIDEFNLEDETSLFEYDNEEQNVLYFNDLFPFNVIYPDDLKSDNDNDDDEIDIKQSSGDLAGKKSTTLVEYYESGNLEVLES
ncbi:hypothetical protein Tco_0060584 [Tanacetum coccineum]